MQWGYPNISIQQQQEAWQAFYQQQQGQQQLQQQTQLQWQQHFQQQQDLFQRREQQTLLQIRQVQNQADTQGPTPHVNSLEATTSEVLLSTNDVSNIPPI